MNDERDIERLLKKFDGGPGSRVRDAVLSEFKQTNSSKSESRYPVGFWKKPIPMYAVLVCVMLALGIAFFAGQLTQPARESVENAQEIQPGSAITSADDIQWTVTQRDVL